MGSISDLRQDLVARSRSQLLNVDRLTEELEAHIDEFRKLLERKRKNNISRNKLQGDSAAPTTSVVEIDGSQYELSGEFKSAAIIVADSIDLDEIEAARFCIAVQDEASETDQTLAFRAILKFQDHQHNLLDCIRLVFKQSLDDDDNDDEAAIDYFQHIVSQIVRPGMQGTSQDNGDYWKKCVHSLSEVEAQIQQTQNHVQAAIMTGQPLDGDYGELLQSQRMLLTRQHEELASIMCYLIQSRHVSLEGYRAFLSKAAATESTTAILSHFLPILIAGSARFGSDSATSDSEAQDIHRMLAPGPGQLQWKNTALQAAATVCWLVEYSSRFLDGNVAGAKDTSSDDDRQQLFFDCLDKNAFQFMLATADFMEPEVWHDPAKMGLVKFLLDNTTQFAADAVAANPDFARLTMQEFQNFAEALVSHMPDALRQMRDEEDNKRRNFLGDNTTSHGYEMHLERLLLIIAYAYQDDPSAAMDFWSDTESNMYGFLRWTSKRLPTPRVAAFCELLRSLASNEKSATHAHSFLMEDGTITVQRSRKAHGVSWSQIFSELEVYANSIKNKPAAPQPSNGSFNALADPDIVEAETPIMLEAYLRLTAHIIQNSTHAQNWVLREQPFRLHEIVLQLAQSSSPAAVQACCLNMMAALVTGKPADVNDGLWVAIDNWLAAGNNPNSSGPRLAGVMKHPEREYLRRIGADAEVATAFTNLLNALVSPAPGSETIDELPFPETLGSAHRSAGIETYVDFVLGQAFALLSTDPTAVEDRMQLSVLRHACLTFVHICLSTFNEQLAAMNTSDSEASAAKTRSFEVYARLHPFARTMEWLFNDGVIGALMHTAQQHIDELDTLDDESPLVQATIKAVQVMQLAIEMQPTYFDLVRPLVKTQSTRRSSPVANPAISSFDEVLVLHLDLAISLARYTICRHTELVLSSTNLLRIMSQSRKIIGHIDGPISGRNENRLVSRLSEWSDALQAELKSSFHFDLRVFELQEDPVIFIRAGALLDLLNTSLSHSPDRPALAHLLLGFDCQESSVNVMPGSFFADGKSLFHAMISAIVNLPPSFGDNHIHWLQKVRTGCVQVLSRLAYARMTSSIVLAELRIMDFFPAIQEITATVARDAIWDDALAQDSSLLFGPGAEDLQSFVRERENMIDLLTEELHAVSEQGMESSRNRYMSMLLESGVQGLSTSMNDSLVFRLFDFFDLAIAAPMEADVKYLGDVDASQYLIGNQANTSLFDLKQVRQALLLKKRQLWLTGKIHDTNEEQQYNDEMLAMLTVLEARNRYTEIISTQLDALESWSDMLVTLLSSPLPPSISRTSIAREALHVILPRVERAFQGELDAAAQLMKLALSVVRTLEMAKENDELSLVDGSLERLSKMFLICLRAITNTETGLALRDVCYRVCCIIVTISSRPGRPTSSQQVLDIFKDNSDRVIRTMAEDALSGRSATRVSTLLFLDAILRFATSAGRSNMILRPLLKVNFIPVLIDSSIGSVSSTFENATADLTSALSFFYTSTVLLLGIAQAQDGPQIILNSNFIASVEDSRLFSTDPDIGLDVDNDAALDEFYGLLAAIVRILVTIVVRRGPGDGAVMQMARKFLSDNRNSVSAIFKLTSRQSSKVGDRVTALQVASELEHLMLVTGFIEDDEASAARYGPRTTFS